MNHQIEFDSDEVEFLQELLNIAFGSAAAIISDMLDTFATLHIPNINLLSINEIQTFINDNFKSDEENYVFSQQFRGDLEGEAIFISNYDSIKNLGTVMSDQEDSINDIEELIDSSSELMNILNSATIKNIATDLNKDVFFAQPSIKSIKSNEIVSNTNISQYTTIIVVSTILDFKKEDIKGTLYILLKPKTIQIIKDKAEIFFEGE